MTNKAKWNFREIDSEEMRKDLNEEGEFDTETIELNETLVREVLQNSSDARDAGLPSEQPVKVVFRFGTVLSPDGRELCGELLSGIVGHLEMTSIKAPQHDLTTGLPYLSIEDFGTKGLTGSWTNRDGNSFDGFFYSHGVSGKGDGNLGSRGLGKIVMTMASKYRAKFAVTLPIGTTRPWAMGMTAMQSHDNNEGEVFASHARWGVKPDDGNRTHPVEDSKTVRRLTEAFNLTDRETDKGLSVVVPLPLNTIRPESLIRAVLKNHYFQILLGELVVVVDDVPITPKTFEALATEYLPKELSERRLAFIYEVVGRLQDKAEPHIVALDEGYVNKHSFDDAQRAIADTELGLGGALHVRVPFSIRRLGDQKSSKTYIDLFFRNLSDGSGAWSQYSRGGLVISDESRRFNGQALAALVAPKGSNEAGSLLRDAENAAHTKWSEKVRVEQRWDEGWSKAYRMATSLHRAWEFLQERREYELPDLLNEFLSIPDEGKRTTGKKGRKKKTVKPEELPTPKPPLFSVRRTDTGFILKPGRGATGEENTFPAQVRIAAAYDIDRGNPLKKWQPVDFVMGKDDIVVTADGCEFECTDNKILATVNSPEFSLEVSGFDTNRDLQLESRRLPS